MNISQIPDNVLLKIFRFLPARDFIRCGGVNEQFRRISIEATSSELKSIDLEAKIFEIITEEQLGWLFQKCWKGLEKIKFRRLHPKFVEIFGQFSFPKLVELDLSFNDVDDENFGKFMRQDRNIRILKCGFPLFRVVFPHDVISEKLMALDVMRADEDFFVSATGHCPNLRFLSICYMHPPINNLSASSDARILAILTNFFASCSKLAKFFTEDPSINSALMRVDSFWRLNLRVIALRRVFDETVIEKFISSFRHLEAISFKDGKVTPNMVTKMASLPKLRMLRVPFAYVYWDADLDPGMNGFVGSEILQHLEFPQARISPTTLKGFIRHCPQLRFLWIGGVKEVETIQDAANFVRSLNEFSATSRSCHLEIRIPIGNYEIWKSKEVKDALKDVEEKLMFHVGGRKLQLW